MSYVGAVENSTAVETNTRPNIFDILAEEARNDHARASLIDREFSRSSEEEKKTDMSMLEKLVMLQQEGMKTLTLAVTK